MNRRGFLGLLGAAIAGIAVDQAIPLGRVWSFPKEIAVPKFTVPAAGNQFLNVEYITAEALERLRESLNVAEYFDPSWEKRFAMGQTIHVRMPQRFQVYEITHVFDHYEHPWPPMNRVTAPQHRPAELLAKAIELKGLGAVGEKMISLLQT